MVRLFRRDVEMSEAFVTMCVLTMSGGLQDAYSYLVRGRVFANAQTGNIVLMGVHLVEGETLQCVHYLIPVLAFALGVFISEQIGFHLKQMRRVHWRQIVLLLEVALLFLVGFLPERFDVLANALVSFSCAMQVQAFRKVHGYPFASTMCIGNLRSGVAAFSSFLHSHDPSSFEMAVHYLLIIAMFTCGAALGAMLVPALGTRSIWVSDFLLLVCMVLMGHKN